MGVLVSVAAEDPAVPDFFLLLLLPLVAFFFLRRNMTGIRLRVVLVVTFVRVGWSEKRSETASQCLQNGVLLVKSTVWPCIRLLSSFLPM